VKNFYKIFGDSFQGSPKDILCEFGDYVFSKSSCWDFDFQVREILTTLFLRGHLYTSFGDSVHGVGNFCNILNDGFQYSFANIHKDLWIMYLARVLVEILISK
jgi:hypothetical protein